jgi:GTP cyclohydrolase I
MTTQIKLSWEACHHRARKIAKRIRKDSGHSNPIYVYPIPNGGIPAAQLIECQGPAIVITEDEARSEVIVDDIIDSGETREKQQHFQYFQKKFYALVDKQGEDRDWFGYWVSFPWERMKKEGGPQDNVKRILQYIGEDPNRDGLQGTPDRVVRSYEELFCGYRTDPDEILKTFDLDDSDEMIVLRDIEFYSTCEHHLMPFFGKAHIAYIPSGPVIGVSKLARLLEIFSRRVQIQERLTKQITDWLDKKLEPLGSACHIEARHLCMTARGVNKQGSIMSTSSLTGVFREKPEARQEFFSLIGK